MANVVQSITAVNRYQLFTQLPPELISGDVPRGVMTCSSNSATIAAQDAADQTLLRLLISFPGEFAYRMTQWSTSIFSTTADNDYELAAMLFGQYLDQGTPGPIGEIPVFHAEGAVSYNTPASGVTKVVDYTLSNKPTQIIRPTEQQTSVLTGNFLNQSSSAQPAMTMHHVSRYLIYDLEQVERYVPHVTKPVISF